MKAPVSVCLIVRNEAPRIIPCLESLRPYVEEICVLDTGSTDGSVEAIRASGLADRFETFWGCNEGGSQTGRIEDFALARNRSFDLARQPWILWVDGDDVVRGAEHLAAITEKYRPVQGAVMVMMPYEYSRDHLGNVTCLHYRERLVRGPRQAFNWIGPVHEVLVPLEAAAMPTEESVVFVHHREGKSEEPRRNLRILERWHANQPEGSEIDARMLYYTALEYAHVGDIAKSIDFHMKYVEKSGWDDEKCLSLLELARHHLALGNLDESIRWSLKAVDTCETWREPLFALGRAHYMKAQKSNDRREWERAANYFRKGLAMPPTQTPLFINPLEARYEVHTFHTVALAQTGAIEEALRSCEEGLKAVPQDGNLNFNRSFFKGAIARNRLRDTIGELEEIGKAQPAHGISTEQAFVMRRILDGTFEKRVERAPEAPRKIDLTPTPEVKNVVQIARPSGLDVVIYTGQAYERWSPETIAKTGIGGSETMAWEMAKRLRARGCRVRVYADSAGLEGTHEGVEWIDWQRFRDPGKCDVLISSRIPEVVDFPWEARARVAWVHDVHMGPGLTNKRALRFDRFLCLSEWHKAFFLSNYRYVHPDQVIVTRNGIDLDLYRADVARNPHRMIYSSSPDRGLEQAMKVMPAIRLQVPDAELHVFYGFDNWEKSHDPGQRALCGQIKAMLQAYEQHGVVHHGRVSAQQLALEQAQSGVWFYPTWFFETSCRTAMEAQLAGLHTITTPRAALPETAQSPLTTWLPDFDDRTFLPRAVEAAVQALTCTLDTQRAEAQALARQRFSLDALADDWVAMLNKVVEEVERDVLPPYKAAAS